MKVQTFFPGGYEPTCQGPLYYVARVQGVSHSNGYLLKPVYASHAPKLDRENIDAWGNVTDVIAVNTAVESCSSSADTCTQPRSDEHASELQSLMRHTYAVVCLNNKIMN